MIGVTSGLVTLRALGARVPRDMWLALLVVAALWFGWRWHGLQVRAAFAEGGRTQAQADRVRFAAASAAAALLQEQLRAALAARQGLISKGSDDALVARNTDLERRYDDLRMRWAAYRTGAGGAGANRPAAVSGTAIRIDDAACAAAGWVSFDIAAAAAEAADRAIAKDDAWMAWIGAQAAAWPGADDGRDASVVPAMGGLAGTGVAVVGADAWRGMGSGEERQ